MKISSRRLSASLAALALCVALGAVLFAQAGAAVPDPRTAATGVDPGCVSRTLVSMGGPAPRNPHTLAVRWIGHSNYELAYNGQIILLDAYYDRNAGFPPLGFKAADVKKANLILIGHGHSDHMADAASVGTRTGAIVAGAPLTAEKLLLSMDPKHVRSVTGKGDETIDIPGIKVEPVLGRHGEPTPAVVTAFSGAMRASIPPPVLTAEQKAAQTAAGARSVNSPLLLTEGSLAYLMIFDTGFRLMYRDTGGFVTDLERAAIKRAGGRVDLAIAATSSGWIPSITIPKALEFMREYKPDVYMPAHHDDDIWRPTESLFQAMKDENPNLVTVSKEYREPTCFNTENNISKRR